MNQLPDELSLIVKAAASIEDHFDQNIYACYQCGKCTASCPYGLQPHRIVRLLQLGKLEEAQKDFTPKSCASCMTCQRVCPKELSPMRLNKTVAELSPGGQKRSARSKIFANIHTITKQGSRFAPVSNWMMNLPGTGWFNHFVFGIHKSRKPPPYTSTSFPDWFSEREAAGNDRITDPDACGVVLFHDTFMDYHFPKRGEASVRLIEGTGHSLELADNVCCGRPLISKGFEEEALKKVRTNVERLYEVARQGKWIVGSEASCLLTIRDEYPQLTSGELRKKAQVVAERTLFIDEFLVMEGKKGGGPTFRDDQEKRRPLLLHTHCHHKALGTPEDSRLLLEHAGYEVKVVPANCCGMAGSFGAEKEHFKYSKRTFEEGVGLAIGEHPDTEVAVTGFSCRVQIDDLSEQCPRHLVEWLADALVESNEGEKQNRITEDDEEAEPPQRPCLI